MPPSRVHNLRSTTEQLSGTLSCVAYLPLLRMEDVAVRRAVQVLELERELLAELATET
jgi:hypothetical protein